MKIAHLVSAPGLNGQATSCKMLAEAQARAGNDVLIVSRANSWIERQPLPHSIVRLSTSFATRPSELRRVGYALRDWGVNIVHCRGSRANKYGMVFRLAAGTPVVTTADARHFQLPWRFFPAVVAPSIDTANYHIRYNRVPPNRIHVIPNMMDVSHVPRLDAIEKVAVRVELGINERAFVIGNVGTICKRKNQIDALRILKKLVSSIPDARLVLVGNQDEDGPNWRRLVDDPDIALRLIRTGPREDTLRIMSAFDVFLFVSKKEEGPIAPLEAMASGLPIVSYKVGNVANLVETGVNGFLVNQGDIDAASNGILQLYENLAIASQFGAASREKIKTKFSSASILPHIEAVYRKVISGSHPKIGLKIET